MKCSLGISNFLKAISSLSCFTVFLYFFALIAEEGVLISPCYSLELCIQMGISFLFSFAFCFSSFHSLEYQLLPILIGGGGRRLGGTVKREDKPTKGHTSKEDKEDPCGHPSMCGPRQVTYFSGSQNSLIRRGARSKQ